MPFPVLGPSLPPRGNRFSRSLARWILRRAGWDFEGEVPDVPKLVLIGAPHTSNWDFAVSMLTMFGLGLEVHFVGKHTLFYPPAGWLMRWLGGTPVRRNAREGVVSQLVEKFAHHEQYILGFSPEGTRRRVETWKTGFYHVAAGAEVPILPVFFDYGGKRVGVGQPLYPSGDMDADMTALRAFYAPFEGKKPELYAG